MAKPKTELYVPEHLMKKALKIRHKNDSFFTEVKNGPTHWSEELLIMDAVAIKKSWANPRITGYEIKSSRSDFLADEKWRGYLPYCNEFLFVCPKGVIEPDEIPEDIGLIYYNPEKRNLWTSRRGAYKKIDPPVDMFRYLIMRWDGQDYPFFSSKREYFEEYVRDKVDKKNLGYHVKSKMAQDIVELARQVESLKRELEASYMQRTFKSVKEKLEQKTGSKMDKYEVWDVIMNAIETGQIVDIEYQLRTIERMVEDIKSRLG